ncbi:hypothetical protein NQ317_015301 [Molorchus minor]|uniref:Ionotropic receptor n=1 Tax=Molorchus minor TaxID=1323400 RepID=A0ABQ9JS25_9CUCU|nr:hypothetical protein NQ317_015301 [Molorchus minor]
MKTNSPVWLLKNLEREIRLTMERFNDRKYLILAGNGTEDKVVDVFKLKELDYISDLLVVQENFESVGSINSYNILTHKYFGAINNSDCILLDVWWPVNKTFMLGNNLFPNKLINQMGRALRIATFEYEPYSIIGPTPDEYKGSELSTAVAFAKMYNMTPFSIINPEDYWGEIFDNWTGNGLLGNLVIDKADIGLGALYTWEVDYHFLDLSKPLVRSGITCLVPAPKLAAGWLTPLRSYSKEMWIAVVVIFLVSSLSLLLIQRCYGKIYGNINIISYERVTMGATQDAWITSIQQADEAIISSMDSIVQKAVKYYYYRHKEEHTLVKLKWVHVEGAFGALCIGCIISIFVFILEIIINRLQIICIGH